MSGFQIDGLREVSRTLGRLDRGLNREIESAMGPIVEALERESRDGTPVDEGDLRDSHETFVEVRGNVIRAGVEVGKGQFAKAVVVHEDMQASHDDGGPKFLERPLMALRGTAGRRMASGIDLKRAAR